MMSLSRGCPPRVITVCVLHPHSIAVAKTLHYILFSAKSSNSKPNFFTRSLREFELLTLHLVAAKGPVHAGVGMCIWLTEVAGSSLLVAHNNLHLVSGGTTIGVKASTAVILTFTPLTLIIHMTVTLHKLPM